MHDTPSTVIIEAEGSDFRGIAPRYARVAITPEFRALLNDLSALIADRQLDEIRVKQSSVWQAPEDYWLYEDQLCITHGQFWFEGRPGCGGHHRIATVPLRIYDFLSEVDTGRNVFGTVAPSDIDEARG